MNNNISQNASINDVELCVFITIKRNHKSVIEGSFIISTNSGISCIGENHPIEFGVDQNNLYKTGIFKGLVLEHKIEEELATISMTMLNVVEDKSKPLGVRQVVSFQTGITMGIFAGSKSEESFVIDQNHILFYKTILFRQKTKS